MEYEIKDGKLIIDIVSLNKELEMYQKCISDEKIKQDKIELLNKKIKEEKEEKDFGFADVDKHSSKFCTGVIPITMSTPDKCDIDQISDYDKDISGYDRINIFEATDKLYSNVFVANYGPDSIYIMVNRTGNTEENVQWPQNELFVNPGGIVKIHDVCELRVRSETQGTKYQVTEDDIISTGIISQVMEQL